MASGIGQNHRGYGQRASNSRFLGAVIPGLIAVPPRGGKIARAHAVSAQIESGNIYLPEPAGAPWVQDLIEEFAAFPNGAYDDQVDAMTQAILHLQQQTAIFPGIIQPSYSCEPGNEDPEYLWSKVERGIPLSPDEIDRLS